MPDEEEGERPSVVFDADESELGALGESLGAPYDPVLVLEVAGSGSIVRVPDVFLRALTRVDDVASAVTMWQAKSAAARARDVASLAAALSEMRALAAEAVGGPGVLALHET